MGAGWGSIGRGAAGVVRSSLNDSDNDPAAQPVLAMVSALADDGLAEAEAEIDGGVESLILHRAGEHVRAFLNVCPHAGRRLDWAPGEFLRTRDGLLVCAAHGATFELGEGLCVGGPCRGSHLRSIAVEVCDGQVRLARSGTAGAGAPATSEQ